MAVRLGGFPLGYRSIRTLLASSNKFAQPFKDFEILGRLGSGGMGTVFKARRKSTGEWVALKVLRPSLSRNDRHVQRLRREAAFGISFDHPHLVKIFGLHEEGGYHYLVMQFVDGKSLRSLLQTWGRFPEDQVIELGIQMASALSHSHGHGVIHRDVKPGNIIVDEAGHAMLTDLGLAKGETDTALTMDGSTVGTPQYMSPEQAQNPKTVGVEGDLYSLGATLYHMSVGQPPFDGESIGQVITKLLHQKADSADSLNPEVGPGLNLVLGRLLLKDPELRYRSADELLADLRLIQAGEAPRVDPRLLERDVILVDRPWYRQPVSLSLAGLLLLVGVLAVVFFPSERDPIPRTLEELRPRIQALASSGEYKSALRMLDTAEVEARESANKTRYRSDLLSEFDRRLRRFLEQKGPKEFRNWLQSNGLANWQAAYLDTHVPDQIYATYGYAPSSLPEPLGQTWKAWRLRAQQGMTYIVEDQARDRIEELEARYKREESPKVAGLLDQHRYREALELVESYLTDPWQTRAESVHRKPVLPRGLSHLLDEFLEERRVEVRGIRTLAVATLEHWKRDLDRLVRDIRLHTEEEEFEIAQSKLDLIRKKLLPAHLPWSSLPRTLDYRSASLGYESDIRDLEGDLQRAEERSLRAHAEAERRRFFIKQDLAHDMLAKNLDFVEARRVLTEMKLLYGPAQQLRREFLGEIRELEQFVFWVYSLLESNSSARRAQDWTVQGITRRREFLKLDRKAPVWLHFAKHGGEVEKVPFPRLDRFPMVQKIETELAPDTWKQKRRGMGLYLFFGDEFEKAQIYFGNFDVNQAQRQERRRLWLAEEKGNREHMLRNRLLEVEGHLSKENLQDARMVLQTIKERYAGSKALSKAAFRLVDLEVRIKNLEKREALAGRVPIPLRNAVQFFAEDPVAKSLGEAARVRAEIDLRRRDVLPKGLQEWRGGPAGLEWRPATPENPEKDWRNALRLSLPLFEKSRPFVFEFQIEIPADGQAPVALELVCAGVRLLFVQLPGRPVLILPDPPADLGAALKAALKMWKAGDKQREWYLLPAIRYAIHVELGRVQAGRRDLRIQVDGRKVATAKKKVKDRPQSKTMAEIRSLSALQVSRVDVTGWLRR